MLYIQKVYQPLFCYKIDSQEAAEKFVLEVYGAEAKAILEDGHWRVTNKAETFTFKIFPHWCWMLQTFTREGNKEFFPCSFEEFDRKYRIVG